MTLQNYRKRWNQEMNPSSQNFDLISGRVGSLTGWVSSGRVKNFRNRLTNSEFGDQKSKNLNCKHSRADSTIQNNASIRCPEKMESVPQVKMVSGIPSKLKIWWTNFDLGSQMAIRRRLGCLISLFDIFPDQHLVRALIYFWDPDRNTKELRCFENNWVSLDYLYERYGCRDGYKLFKNELSCTLDHWQTKRPIAFTVAVVGTLIFPLEHGKISTCICSVARALFEGVDSSQLTLAPMILAEIFRALGRCKRGETSLFEGCNLILQIWAMEHFYQRPNMVDICFSESNKIVSFYDRTKRFVSPVGINDWYEFLASRTGDQIQWKYPLLLNTKKAYIRCKRLYYIELIGLKGLQPYAPLRLLRQFGQKQIIPL
ncbi:hypothetical protein RND71_039672 [Anisodus tanguticus]|uniref:Aminotransferase-like plant mobile domain-containing protein n=1 Tax=Anisodus tanguticus TaxID=243964 RepID=A0AAE1UVJ8_9SOLA|nr:hypothetical protein RND71_039672 [Anisodus tanguticus]